MSFRRALLLLALLATGEVFAFGRPPQDYVAPADDSPKAKRSKMRAYNEAPGDGPPEETPWAFIGLAVLAFGVATPLGYRAWNNMKQQHEAELEAQAATGKPSAPRKAKPKAAPAVDEE